MSVRLWIRDGICKASLVLSEGPKPSLARKNTLKAVSATYPGRNASKLHGNPKASKRSCWQWPRRLLTARSQAGNPYFPDPKPLTLTACHESDGAELAPTLLCRCGNRPALVTKREHRQSCQGHFICGCPPNLTRSGDNSSLLTPGRLLLPRAGGG